MFVFWFCFIWFCFVLPVDVQLFQHHLLKSLLFLYWIGLAYLSEISWLYLCGLFQALYSVPLIYLSILVPVPHCLDSVQFSRSVMSNFLQPHGLQHSRHPCPSATPGVYPNSCPSSQWCHPTISSSVVPFAFCLQSFPASGSFLVSQFFASGGQILEF